MKGNYKIVIFDFFGVICSEVSPIWFERYFLKEKAKELKQVYLRPADIGEVSTEKLFHMLADLVKTTPNTVRDDWFSLVTIRQEVVSFIRHIKPNFKIVLCSNAPSHFLRQILEENNLEDIFDEVIISSEIGAIKPESIFFIKTLNILDATPENILFIDDNSENTDAAEKLGIKSIIFSTKQNLEKMEFFRNSSC